MTQEITEMQKLERLVGAPIRRKVQVTDENGENPFEHEFLLLHIKVGRIPAIVSAAGSLMLYLTDSQHKLTIEALFHHHSRDCLNLISALLNKPQELVDNLEIDDAILLLTDLIELNIDFFVRRVLPAFLGAARGLSQEAREKIGRVMQAIGETSLTSSSATGTESPLSGTTAL